MLEFFFLCMLVALAASWVYMVMGRTGAFDWLQVNGGKLVSEAARCRFCAVWWISVFVALVLAVVFWDFEVLITPVFSTIITLNLIKNCFG